jgi:hypothetical protein
MGMLPSSRRFRTQSHNALLFLHGNTLTIDISVE